MFQTTQIRKSRPWGNSNYLHIQYRQIPPGVPILHHTAWETGFLMNICYHSCFTIQIFVQYYPHRSGVWWAAFVSGAELAKVYFLWNLYLNQEQSSYRMNPVPCCLTLINWGKLEACKSSDNETAQPSNDTLLDIRNMWFTWVWWQSFSLLLCLDPLFLNTF